MHCHGSSFQGYYVRWFAIKFDYHPAFDVGYGVQLGILLCILFHRILVSIATLGVQYHFTSFCTYISAVFRLKKKIQCFVEGVFFALVIFLDSLTQEVLVKGRKLEFSKPMHTVDLGILSICAEKVCMENIQGYRKVCDNLHIN